MCLSAVVLATSRSALLLAYSKCRTCPGCTTSNTPWHMITRFSRGGGPMIARNSSGVLILCRYRSINETISGLLLNFFFAEIAEPGFCRLGNRCRVPQRSLAPALDIGEHALHAVRE